MRKFVATAALMALALVPVRADLTFTQKMTIEGQAAAMAGAAAPTITMRIKGQKARADVDVMGQTISTITDVATGQVILLNPTTKSAEIVAGKGAAPVSVPTPDVSLTPTGKSQTIDGLKCDEYAFSMTLDMAAMVGQTNAQVPPEAAAAMQGAKMVMKGSTWLAKDAPGAAEYASFTKAAIASNLFTAATGMQPGQSGGLDKLMSAFASAPGLPYLGEIDMTFEGTGPMVEMMKQMGAMKIIQRTSGVSTAPIADDVFRVPEGYTTKNK